MKSCCGGKNTQVLWCEHWGGCHNERRVGVTKFHFPIILGLVIMSWFCSGQPNIRCVFHSPVFFLVSQPVDRIQTLERKLKALEDERARRSTEEALITLRRHLNRPLNMFDRYEAVELLHSLVSLARNEAHEKADTYVATLDEVKARADLLDKESLQRLLVGLLGDPVRAKVAKEATSILKSSSGASAAPLR